MRKDKNIYWINMEIKFTYKLILMDRCIILMEMV